MLNECFSFILRLTPAKPFMILYKQKKDIHEKIEALKSEGKTIGFVPTMGALHQGHLSLIKASCQQNDITVCSIFINPAQFNDSNDFNKYPVTIESDILQLTEAGNNFLFLPSVEEMYPEGKPSEHYDLGELETTLEGQYRLGHFQGVCQVVNRLFTIIQPHRAYFGQKDYQQCMVIKRLIKLTKSSIDIIIYPTVREAGGLAMSSRNMRLSEEYKQRATALYKALSFIKENKLNFSIPVLTRQAVQTITDAGFQTIEYVEIRDAETLKAVNSINENKPTVALVAAFIGGVRLIDNMLL